MAENFPSLGKETDIQVQKAQRVPNKRLTQREPHKRHFIIKKLTIKRES